MEHPFGIDFGGTGIKGAPVDLEVGDFAHDRIRIDTPRPATPQAVAGVFGQIIDSFPVSTRPVGVTVPGIVRRGVVHSAANIDKSWIGEDADAIFTAALGREVHVVNDADAAGLAEAEYGAAKGRGGLVMVITLGTGIGSAMIWNGQLVPNSEMGHLELDGAVAEATAATSAREREGLSWEAVVGAAHGLLPAPRTALLPRPVRDRRRRQQVLGQVRPPHQGRDRDGARDAAEPRRHRRRRPRGAPHGRHRGLTPYDAR